SIPNSVTSISDGVFSDCSGLTNISIPNSVTSIGSGVFLGTKWLDNKRAENLFVIVNGILIDGRACKGNINIPDGVTSIGNSAFELCGDLTSVGIPNSVTNIAYAAFSHCSHLVNVSIPSSVTSIGDDAFYDCSRLTSISIPSSVTSIGGAAFARCSGLTSISIPNSVTSIGYIAFQGCNENLIIYTEEGSYAVTYAKENGLTVKLIPKNPPNQDNINNIPPKDVGNNNTSENTDQKIQKQPKLKKVKKFKAVAKKKGLALKWKKVSGASGYQIQVSTKKNFKGAKTYTVKNRTKYTISKLKSRKKYYIRIRAYKNYRAENGKPKKAYGKYATINKKTK
ncbi:MAG: leucine-rich repeat protein, partial [Lachnospiraceae bacterium]|nr:leucine-rich repeat protein [Lachnospiraceae bacterium]